MSSGRRRALWVVATVIGSFLQEVVCLLGFDTGRENG